MFLAFVCASGGVAVSRSHVRMAPAAHHVLLCLLLRRMNKTLSVMTVALAVALLSSFGECVCDLAVFKVVAALPLSCAFADLRTSFACCL